MDRSFHETVLLGKLWQAVRQATNREEGGTSSRMTNAQKPGNRLQMPSGRSTLDMRVPPVENHACAAFKEYGEVPETLPLDFTEDDVMWVALKLSGAAGALGALMQPT